MTKPGIDKVYGTGKLRDTLRLSLIEMIYIGAALSPGGNDYPAEEAGVVSTPVKGPDDTNVVQDDPCLSWRQVSVAMEHAGEDAPSNRRTEGLRMKTATGITCAFPDVGDVLLTDGWDHLARKRDARHFKLEWADM